PSSVLKFTSKIVGSWRGIRARGPRDSVRRARLFQLRSANGAAGGRLLVFVLGGMGFVWLHGQMARGTRGIERSDEGSVAVPELPSARLHVNLIVQESIYAGITRFSRQQEPVSVGVPLADAAGVRDTSQLGLEGASAGQFRVLGRWPSGNI